MSALQSSVAVQFDTASTSGATSRGSLQWEVDQEKISELENQVYLRLYPGTPEKVIYTSGVLRRRGQEYASIVEELVFTGDLEVSLGKANPKNIVTQILGSFYDEYGEATGVALIYDPSRNVLRANKKGYGVVQVNYQAPYDSYLFTYSGTPCQLNIVEGQVVYTGGYHGATIIAINFTDDVTGKITMTASKCSEHPALRVIRANEAKLPSLRLEMHKEYPPKIADWSKGSERLRAGCKVKLFPNTAATVVASSGQVLEDPELANTEKIINAVTFNGSGSVNLTHQPISPVTVSSLSGFVNIWGTPVNPSFATKGESVLDVTWINEHTYTQPVLRVVGADEIVAVGFGQKVIPVYGSIKVAYTTAFKVYEVIFDAVNEDNVMEGFKKSHMIAWADTQTAQLMLSPPSVKEF